MIPFSYSIRNLKTRRLTTILTVSGMALVVFVFATILMLTEGLKKTLVETGSYDNVVIIRKSSVSEVQSGIDRYQASIVETDPEIALGSDGKPLLAKETVVLIGIPKISTGRDSNVTIRGVSERSLMLRPQVKLTKGRMPKAGSTEIAAGSSIARRFEGADLGDTLRFGTRNWRVVGVFDAGNTGFSSEVWADTDQLMQAFRKPVYSSVIFKLRDPSGFDALKTRIENNPRLTLEAKRETRYYLDQSEMMAKFLNVLGHLPHRHLFSRGHNRRHDHHVFGCCKQDGRDRNHAGPWLPEDEHPRLLSGRSSPAGAFRRHHGTFCRLLPPVLHHFNT